MKYVAIALLTFSSMVACSDDLIAELEEAGIIIVEANELFAPDLTATTDFNTPLSANLDVDLSDFTSTEITATVVTGPTEGTIEFDDGTTSYTFTPAEGFSGEVSLTYQLATSSVTSNIGTITIVVLPPSTQGLADSTAIFARYINMSTHVTIRWENIDLNPNFTYAIYRSDDETVTKSDTMVAALDPASNSVLETLTQKPTARHYYGIIASNDFDEVLVAQTQLLGLHNKITSFSSPTADGYGELYDIIWLQNGNIAIPDYDNDIIQIVKPDGALVTHTTNSPVAYQVAEGPDGKLYAPEYDTYNIVVYDANLQVVDTIVGLCDEAGESLFDRQGNMIVACYEDSSREDSIHKYDGPSFAFSSNSTKTTDVVDPWYGDILPEKDLIVIGSYDTSTFYLMNTDGGNLRAFDVNTGEWDIAIFDLVFSTDELIYIADENDNEYPVKVFDLEGKLVDLLQPDFNDGYGAGIDLDANGAMVLSTWDEDLVYTYTP